MYLCSLVLGLPFYVGLRSGGFLSPTSCLVHRIRWPPIPPQYHVKVKLMMWCVFSWITGAKMGSFGVIRRCAGMTIGRTHLRSGLTIAN